MVMINPPYLLLLQVGFGLLSQLSVFDVSTPVQDFFTLGVSYVSKTYDGLSLSFPLPLSLWDTKDKEVN